MAPPTDVIRLPKNPSSMGTLAIFTTHVPMNPPIIPTEILPKKPKPSPPKILLATYPQTAPKNMVPNNVQSIAKPAKIITNNNSIKYQ